jgi:hypothetical protein
MQDLAGTEWSDRSGQQRSLTFNEHTLPTPTRVLINIPATRLCESDIFQKVSSRRKLVRRFLCSRLFLVALVMLTFATASFGQIAISVSFGPPALPVYAQPICPAPGYIWVPGYWAYDPNFGDYYWVPGTWVLAPQVGYLWTPPWWGWSGAAYIFHPGYWGPTVGFYGGINYGWGYFGHGYEGGRWNNGNFYYNRSVNNINVTNITNVYNVNVVNNNVNRVSYNGGPGGVVASPTTTEEAAARERHIAPVEAQTRHVEEASRNQQLRASVNQGRPPIAATPKPATFNGAGVVQARAAGAPYHPPVKAAAPEANGRQPVPHPPNETARPTPNQTPRSTPNEAAHPANAPAPGRQNNAPRPPAPVHAQNVPPHSPPPSNTGNSEAERQAQQRQQQMYQQQQQEHQKLQQQQEQDHQRMAQQQATNAQMQQMERQHQQQTMQMEQRHAQQEQQMARPPAPAPAPHNEAAPRPAEPPKH